MIIYRPHRGGLLESLAEAREFNSFKEMKTYIVDYYTKSYTEMGFNEPPFGIDDIVIDEDNVGDERIAWHDDKYVCVKRMGSKVYDCPQCIGMCATDYEKLTPEEVNERINNMR